MPGKRRPSFRRQKLDVASTGFDPAGVPEGAERGAKVRAPRVAVPRSMSEFTARPERARCP